MSITGPDPKRPTKVGVAMVDIITGLHAAVGILAALRHRDRTGQGQRVEVNLLSSLLSSLTNQGMGFVAAGVVPSAMGNRHPSIAPYEVFPAADRPLVVAVGNDRQFGTMARVLGLAWLAEDLRFKTNASRVGHRTELFAILTTAFSQHSAEHWCDALMAVGIPVGPINNISEAFGLASRLGLDPIAQIENPSGTPPVAQVANPIRLSETPASYRSAPPLLGADTNEVLKTHNISVRLR